VKNFLENYAEIHGLPSPGRNVNRITQSLTFRASQNYTFVGTNRFYTLLPFQTSLIFPKTSKCHFIPVMQIPVSVASVALVALVQQKQVKQVQVQVQAL